MSISEHNLRSRKTGPGTKPKTNTTALNALSQSPPITSNSSPTDSRQKSAGNSNLQSVDEAMMSGQECDPIVLVGSNDIDIAQSPDATAAIAGPSGADMTTGLPNMPNLEHLFRDLTTKFENTIKEAVESVISKLKEVETNLGASLEFEHQRVNNLQKNQDEMEKKVSEMEKEISSLKSQMEKFESAANKNERFSRRNNIRLVGIPELPEGQREDCVQIAEDTLRVHFNIERKVERAHRDGRKVEGRQRHILIKLLSYRDKIEIMKKNREVLKNKSFFIVDDLTPVDLREKQKWSKQVQDLYKAGTKLRFYAGKWRQAGGTEYIFN